LRRVVGCFVADEVSWHGLRVFIFSFSPPPGLPRWLT
jgi:hypothetical protein